MALGEQTSPFGTTVWHIVQSSNGNIRYEHFGLSDDIPISANAQ